MPDHLKKIQELLESRIGSIKISLRPDIQLEQDLGLTGNDASEFIKTLSEEFKIDISNFNFAKYFTPEGDSFLSFIVRLFKKKNNFIKIELTIKDLIKAINSGKLI